MQIKEMKVLFRFAVLFCFQESLFSVADKVPLFRPGRISFDALLNGDHAFDTGAFKAAMTQVGMISVTGMFSNSAEDLQAKKDTLAYLHECAVESDVSHMHTFEDGTVRRTLPTHSTPAGIQAFPFNTETATKSCQDFSKSSYAFRSKVALATAAFGKRLMSAFDYDGSQPLLSTENGFAFDTLDDVIAYGEHLEHFHSYQKNLSSLIGTEDDVSTIEWHTDQGLFLAFTPGRKVHCNHHMKNLKDSSTTDGFFIQKKDGSKVEVLFDDGDDLVFLLGDGVNQYVNTKLLEANKLRAVPHALSMPHHDADEARVWYGRMVLPPFDAIHPHYGVAFGKLRDQVIQSASNDGSKSEALSLACSGDRVARDLQEEISCTDNTMMCWHRCMEIVNVTEELCAGFDMVLNCTNPRRQLWDGSHGDFYPGCVAKDAEIATPYPTLPNYPRDNVTCTNATFDVFASTEKFDHEFILPEGNGAKLMWSVVDNEVHAKLAFNGIFGWIALGFTNPEGAKNGMHGSHIIMGLPGGNYSAVTGLDLSMGSTIDEYMISEDGAQSSFRHWMDPITAITRATSGPSELITDSCNTALSFNASSIGQISFNITGEDDLIWGANDVDYFVGYHGMNRGRFFIDWSAGTGRSWVPPPETNTTVPAPAPLGNSQPAPSGNSQPASSTTDAPVAAPTSGVLTVSVGFSMKIVASLAAIIGTYLL